MGRDPTNASPRPLRGLALLLLGAAVVLGLGRSILDSYFTTRAVELPTPSPVTWPALAARVAIVLLDGLRPMEAFNPDYMPALAERRRQAAWGVARASEITMTVPGVRMLGAGVSSDFLEILHNWNPRSSPVTSLFSVARRKGLHTCLYGDHVWKRVFTEDIERHVDTRLDAWSYYRDVTHAPDQSLLDELRASLAAGESSDLLVIHLVGPDHASHRYRVTSERFREYARWMDPRVDELLSSLLATGTTVLLTSDHGMSDGGQHGGDEPTARKTPYLLQGPGIRVGPGPLLSQADLPATLAALLGLPMPPFGEGRVAHEVIAADADTLLAMMSANLRQAKTYLDGYQRKYGNVPQSLLDGVPDLAALAAQQGTSSALAQADQYLEAYGNERHSVGKSVGRTWVWLLTILVFAVFVLLPAARFPLPRGTLGVVAMALLLALLAWATTAALWPSVLAAMVASLWLGRGTCFPRWPSRHAGLTMLTSGLAVVGLLALAHLGFKRQFRSSTMLGSVSDTYFRVAGYLFVALAAIGYFRWRKPMAASAGRVHAGSGLGIIVLFLLMLPSGRPLLLIAPGLGLGFLWWYRLASMSESGRPRRWRDLLESEWLLFVATLAWVSVESWAGLIGPRIDAERGVLGWALNRAPWVLAAALVVQQLVRGREVAAGRARLTSALSTLSLLVTLPPLLFAHHTTEHFNLLVWLSLLGMVLSAVNFRSPLATYQLGAAAFALTSLFGSASYAFIILALIGTCWLFLLPSLPHEERAGSPPITDDRSTVRPVLAALGICFAWLTVQRIRDGSFSFSDIEVTVGFYGNPTHDLGQGALQVSARFILPMVLLFIPLQRMAASARILGATLALFLLHIGFLLVGFLATQSQFYTPYRLAGELAHFIVLLATVPLIFLLFSARGDRSRAPSPPTPAG